MEFYYEKLEITQAIRKLIVNIYKVTEEFPRIEIYSLVSQLRRASVSVLLNIAEGSNRSTRKDFKHFVRIAIGSLVEVDAALKVSVDLSFISIDEYNRLEPNIKELYFKLIGLDKYLAKSSNFYRINNNYNNYNN